VVIETLASKSLAIWLHHYSEWPSQPKQGRIALCSVMGKSLWLAATSCGNDLLAIGAWGKAASNRRS